MKAIISCYYKLDTTNLKCFCNYPVFCKLIRRNLESADQCRMNTTHNIHHRWSESTYSQFLDHRAPCILLRLNLGMILADIYHCMLPSGFVEALYSHQLLHLSLRFMKIFKLVLWYFKIKWIVSKHKRIINVPVSYVDDQITWLSQPPSVEQQIPLRISSFVQILCPLRLHIDSASW